MRSDFKLNTLVYHAKLTEKNAENASVECSKSAIKANPWYFYFGS